MRRFPTSGTVGLLLSLCLLSGAAPSAFADLTDWSPGPKPYGMGSTFKLRVHYDEHTAPEMVITDGFKRPPRVDGNLIGQIHQVRLAFPNWHGFHSLLPGGSGGGQ